METEKEIASKVEGMKKLLKSLHYFGAAEDVNEDNYKDYATWIIKQKASDVVRFQVETKTYTINSKIKDILYKMIDTFKHLDIDIDKKMIDKIIESIISKHKDYKLKIRGNKNTMKKIASFLNKVSNKNDDLMKIWKTMSGRTVEETLKSFFWKLKKEKYTKQDALNFLPKLDDEWEPQEIKKLVKDLW